MFDQTPLMEHIDTLDKTHPLDSESMFDVTPLIENITIWDRNSLLGNSLGIG